MDPIGAAGIESHQAGHSWLSRESFAEMLIRSTLNNFADFKTVVAELSRHVNAPPGLNGLSLLLPSLTAHITAADHIRLQFDMHAKLQREGEWIESLRKRTALLSEKMQVYNRYLLEIGRFLCKQQSYTNQEAFRCSLLDALLPYLLQYRERIENLPQTIIEIMREGLELYRQRNQFDTLVGSIFQLPKLELSRLQLYLEPDYLTQGAERLRPKSDQETIIKEVLLTIYNQQDVGKRVEIRGCFRRAVSDAARRY